MWGETCVFYTSAAETHVVTHRSSCRRLQVQDPVARIKHRHTRLGPDPG